MVLKWSSRGKIHPNPMTRSQFLVSVLGVMAMWGPLHVWCAHGNSCVMRKQNFKLNSSNKSKNTGPFLKLHNGTELLAVTKSEWQIILVIRISRSDPGEVYLFIRKHWVFFSTYTPPCKLSTHTKEEPNSFLKIKQIWEEERLKGLVYF